MVALQPPSERFVNYRGVSPLFPNALSLITV